MTTAAAILGDVLGLFVGYPLMLIMAFGGTLALFAVLAIIDRALFRLWEGVQRMGLLTALGIILYIPIAIIMNITNRYK